MSLSWKNDFKDLCKKRFYYSLFYFMSKGVLNDVQNFQTSFDLGNGIFCGSFCLGPMLSVWWHLSAMKLVINAWNSTGSWILTQMNNCYGFTRNGNLNCKNQR